MDCQGVGGVVRYGNMLCDVMLLRSQVCRTHSGRSGLHPAPGMISTSHPLQVVWVLAAPCGQLHHVHAMPSSLIYTETHVAQLADL